MQRFLWAALVALFVLTLPGCQCGEETVTQPIQQFAVQGACGTETVYAGPAPVAVQYHVGAKERTRAAIGIPPAVLQCGVNAGYEMLTAAVKGINCAVDSLLPTPTPTATYVYPQYVVVPQVVQQQPMFIQPQAAPCVPQVAPPRLMAPPPPPPPPPRASNCVGCNTCSIPR